MKKILFSILMLCCMTAAWAGPVGDGSYTAATMKELTDAINSQLSEGTSTARITLTADIYMSDLGEGEPGRHTLCSTFSGTLDGNGHTIWAARPEVTHDGGGHYHRQYLFTYCKGATIKNLTFKDFRVQSQDNPNQAIITSQAKNSCVFENITLDHVSVFCNKDNVGAVAGWADNNCTFKDITVKNSDFTTDMHQSGAVVGHAIGCTFTNIKVENCESTTDDGKSGGVAGRTDNCTVSNAEILGTFVWTNSRYGGGVVGYSEHTAFTNCVVDDQSCVWVDGGFNRTMFVEGDAGGIVGYANSNISNCINSALIACDDNEAGGIVGGQNGGNIFDCLNTGLIVSISEGQVKEYYSKYKNKELPCVTKYYKGKEYVVRKTELPNTGDDYYGGIVGKMEFSHVDRCVNIGSMSGTDYAGGIVGEIRGGHVYNCLCDFETPSDKVMGLVGKCEDYENSWLASCVNMSHAKDYDTDFDIHASDVFSYSNNSLDNNELKTGKLCQKLRDTKMAQWDGGAWEQNIGTDAYPIPSGGKGLYHTRKVTNQYGTACFPFPVKSDDKISYYTFSEENNEGQDVKLVFTYVEEVEAGFPVLFRAAEAKDANADNPVEICFNNAGDGFTRDAKVDISVEHWGFWGTFEQKVIDESTPLFSPKNIYYISGGEIRNAKKVTIAPYRAWFLGPNIDTLTGNGTNQARIRFVIEEKDGSTADIELVGADLVPAQKNGKTYSLMGTAVNDNYRGIVIKNGKKIKR